MLRYQEILNLFNLRGTLGRKDLMETFNWSRQTAHRYLQVLKQIGITELVPGTSGNKIRYRLVNKVN